MAARMSKSEHLRVRAEVFKYHSMRKTNQEIAALVGVSHVTVSTLIQEAYRETSLPIVEEALKQDLELLTQMLVIATKRYEASQDPADYAAVDKMLQRRAKMLGYDSATNVNLNVVEVTQEDVAFAALLREEKARNANIDAELKLLAKSFDDVA